MSYVNLTPEQLHQLGESALALAAEPGPERPEINAIISGNATILLVGAELLDRLERIILLLDERLPARDRRSD